MDFEHANLLSALKWSQTSGDHDTAGRIVWALWLYWWLRSYAALGRRAAADVVASSGLSPFVRTRATMSLAALSFAQGDLPAAHQAYTETLAHARREADAEGIAVATAGLGIVALAAADIPVAEHLLREALRLAGGLGTIGYGPWITAFGNVWLGTALFEAGHRDEALTHFQRGLQLARTSGDRLAAFTALWNLSRAEVGHDHIAAHRHLEVGIALSQEVADLSNLSYFLDALVVLEARQPAGGSDPGRAATLLGAAQAFREAAGLRAISYYLPDEAARDAVAAAARSALGATAYDGAVAQGRRLLPAGAVRLALAPGVSRVPTLPRGADPSTR